MRRFFLPCRRAPVRLLLPCLLLLALLACTACRPHGIRYQREQPALSVADSALATQFPLPDHLTAQREFLLAHSQPLDRVIVPDGEDLAGIFSSGVIELVFDEIDGEPSYLYGHVGGKGEDVEQALEFVIYGIPDRKLDRLVPGQPCRVHWVETVVDMQPFDDDRYRYFLVFGVAGE